MDLCGAARCDGDYSLMVKRDRIFPRLENRKTEIITLNDPGIKHTHTHMDLKLCQLTMWLDYNHNITHKHHPAVKQISTVISFPAVWSENRQRGETRGRGSLVSFRPRRTFFSQRWASTIWPTCPRKVPRLAGRSCDCERTVSLGHGGSDVPADHPGWASCVRYSPIQKAALWRGFSQAGGVTWKDV